MTTNARELKLDASGANRKQRRVPAVLSTTFAVQRDGYSEILLHQPENVDLSRAPLPLIESHDGLRLNIGIVENLKISGNKLRGDVVLGNSSRANELWPDIESGIVRSLSVAYLINDQEIEGTTIKVTRWMPYEASLVSIPADPSAGLYRSSEMKNENEQLPAGNENLSRSQRRAASNETNESTGVAAERVRVNEILAIAGADAYKRYDLGELANQAVVGGMSVDEFRERAMSKMHSPPKPTDTCAGYNGSSQARAFNLTRAINGLIDPRSVDNGNEREISDEIAKQSGVKPRGIYMPLGNLSQRAMTVSGNPALVGTQHLSSEFIDLLRARSFVMQLGTRMLPGLTGNVSIPRRTGSSTAAWIAGDNVDSLTPSDSTYDAVALTPRTVGAFTVLSRKLLLQGDPGSEEIIRSDLAAVIAVELDRAAINGSGAANQPLGVVNTVGVNSATFPNIGPAFADILKMEADLVADNADTGSLAYLTTPALAAVLKGRETAAGSGQFVWAAGRDRGTGQMNALPAYASANVPLDRIILGNWDDLLMGMWGAIDIDVDPYYDFAKGSVAIRAFASVDFAVRHPESFAVYSRAP